jgi:hypothetical protein
MEAMSYSSTGTTFSHNNGVEGEVVGSRSTGCMCNLPIKKSTLILHGKLEKVFAKNCVQADN